MTEPPSGWVRFSHHTPEQLDEIFRDARRELAEREARMEREHRELFDRSATEVHHLRLPLSGREVWWRANGYSRWAADEEWCAWKGPEAGTSIEYQESWTVVSGEVYPDDLVEAALVDGTPLGLFRLGCLWFVEYAGPPQTVIVSTNGEPDEIKWIPPSYLSSGDEPGR